MYNLHVPSPQHVGVASALLTTKPEEPLHASDTSEDTAHNADVVVTPSNDNHESEATTEETIDSSAMTSSR